MGRDSYRISANAPHIQYTIFTSGDIKSAITNIYIGPIINTAASLSGF